jgi:hypothetical protein
MKAVAAQLCYVVNSVNVSDQAILPISVGMGETLFLFDQPDAKDKNDVCACTRLTEELLSCPTSFGSDRFAVNFVEMYPQSLI